MRARSAAISGERYSMHHKKQKANSSGSGACKDVRFEAMQRLRYLNKKPLCLQYNLGSNSKRNNQLKAQKREQSLFLVIIVGLIRIIQYLVQLAQTEFWEFVTKPASELFPSEKSSQPQPKPSFSRTRRRPSLSRRYINCTYRRDFGRTARIMALREQRTQLCYF